MPGLVITSLEYFLIAEVALCFRRYALLVLFFSTLANLKSLRSRKLRDLIICVAVLYEVEIHGFIFPSTSEKAFL